MKDEEVSPQEESEGKDPSTWVVMARKPEDLARLVIDKRGQQLNAPKNFRVWTDDFSNIVSVIWPGANK